jgi:Patatin-like phospholipase
MTERSIPLQCIDSADFQGSRPISTCPRILSLDGGGARALAALLILREMMALIQNQQGLYEAPFPCEYFDLIGGTGTGGIIAIMLGRLGMVRLSVLIKC